MFDDMIEEAMGGTSYMDVSDLRAFYYGRRDIYVSFTDDGEYVTKHSSTNNPQPDGLVMYDLRDVVGRKINTNLLYARIFRVPENGLGDFLDINKYTMADFDRDAEKLKKIGWYDPRVIEFFVDEARKSTQSFRPFQKLWKVTRWMAEHSESGQQQVGREWNIILTWIGYAGFFDPASTGILTGVRKPVGIFLSPGDAYDIDILEIQKYRDDPRRRVRDKVARINKTLAGARRRVAKRERDIKVKKRHLSPEEFAAYMDTIGDLF